LIFWVVFSQKILKNLKKTSKNILFYSSLAQIITQEKQQERDDVFTNIADNQQVAH